jgi:hypothetical protein
MTTFTINTDNTITAFASPKEAKSIPAVECFDSAMELGRLAENWPGRRLVEIWNALPGQKPVRKFTSRRVATARIWAAIRSLASKTGAQALRVAPNKPTAGKQVKRVGQRATPREGSKAAQILGLLRRPGGASLDELMKTTAWQRHSVRGYLSILGKKKGLAIKSTKPPEGERTYSIKA